MGGGKSRHLHGKIQQAESVRSNRCAQACPPSTDVLALHACALVALRPGARPGVCIYEDTLSDSRL